ncbi:CHAT domain-containing protein [Roseateles sp. NT4]|uniref:CHAT domain-containing protein n=1 Tax=Roseateles sp. NT4 TaxID=3453715 RepID=UPI003EEB8A83
MTLPIDPSTSFWRAHHLVCRLIVLTGMLAFLASCSSQAISRQDNVQWLGDQCAASLEAVVRELLSEAAVASARADKSSADLRADAYNAGLKTRYQEARLLLAMALREDLNRKPAPVQSDVVEDLSAIARIEIWRSKLGEASHLVDCGLRLSKEEQGPQVAGLRAQKAEIEISVRHLEQADFLLWQALQTLRHPEAKAVGNLVYALSLQANLRILQLESTASVERYDSIAAIYLEALTALDRDPDCPALCNTRAILKTGLAEVTRGPKERLVEAHRIAESALQEKLKLVGPTNDSIATSFQILAHINDRLGEHNKSLVLYRRALGLLLSAENERPEDAQAILSRIAEISEDAAAFCERARGPEGATEAIILYALSVEARQRMRRAGEALSERYQRDLTVAIEGPYRRLANLLVLAGRLPEAEQVLRLLKEEELAVVLRSGSSDPSLVSGTHEQAAEYSKLAAKSLKQWEDQVRLQAKRVSERSASDIARLEDLRRMENEERDDFARFVAALTPSPSSTLYAWVNLQSSRLGRATVEDPTSFGIQFIVEESGLGIVVVSKGHAKGFVQPNITASSLGDHVRRFRAALQYGGNADELACELWAELIKPVLPFLEEAKPDTLVISATGVLRYLPFAALKDPDGMYLVERYAVVSWADAGDGRAGAPRSPWSVAALGLKTSWGRFALLPGVEPELRAIVRKDENPQGLIPGNFWFDEDFDRNRFESVLEGDYNIVHVASHFKFNPGHQETSVLVMGKVGQMLSIRDMRAFDFSKVDLLTLSACETALGGGVANGFDVEGLSAVVLQKQGRRVIASLWKIGDASASAFMKHFYAKLAANPQMSFASALQKTQLQFLKAGTLTSESNEADGDLIGWTEPKYWAPFVLSGSWL